MCHKLTIWKTNKVAYYVEQYLRPPLPRSIWLASALFSSLIRLVVDYFLPLGGLPMQGCGNKDLCPFEEFKVNTTLPDVLPNMTFKMHSASPLAAIWWASPIMRSQEKIVKPHLKHDYNMLCKKPAAAAEEEPSSFSSKLNFFLDLLSRKGYRIKGQDVKTEL